MDSPQHASRVCSNHHFQDRHRRDQQSIRRRFLPLTLLVLLLAGLPTLAGAANMTPEETLAARREAAVLIRAGDAANAQPLYRQLIRENPFDGSLMLGLAHAHLQLGEWQDAIRAFETTLTLGAGHVVGPGFRANLYLDLAFAQAGLGNREATYTAIENALAERHGNRGALMEMPGFESFRSEPRFRRMAGLMPSPPATRVAGWQFDLDLLRDEVNRMFIPPGDARPSERGVPSEFTEALAALRRDITNHNDESILVELMRLITLLGNGHSNVFPTPATPIEMTTLPVIFYAFSDGLYVVHGDGEHAKWRGARVLQFGAMPTAEVVRRGAAFVPKDNPMGTRWLSPFMLSLPLVLQHLGIVNDTDSVALTLQRPNDSTTVVQLAPGPFRMLDRLPLPTPGANSPVSHQPPGTATPYWTKRLPTLDAVYFQYNQIQSLPEAPLPGFLENLFDSLGDKRDRHLVIDLRYNNGGNSFLNRTLLRRLVHFELAHPDNRLYVLMGRNTFSAAQNLVTDIDRMTNATLVGEPSGSRPNHVGEDSQLLLPYSSLGLSVASRLFQASDPTDDRIWIAPHVVVELSSDDYFSGRDPVIEAVQDLIRDRSTSRKRKRLDR